MQDETLINSNFSFYLKLSESSTTYCNNVITDLNKIYTTFDNIKLNHLHLTILYLGLPKKIFEKSRLPFDEKLNLFKLYIKTIENLSLNLNFDSFISIPIRDVTSFYTTRSKNIVLSLYKTPELISLRDNYLKETRLFLKELGISKISNFKFNTYFNNKNFNPHITLGVLDKNEKYNNSYLDFKNTYTSFSHILLKNQIKY